MKINVYQRGSVSPQLLTVQRCGNADNSRARILFCGRWLPAMGFIPGALVQVMPETDGLSFNLCNENIKSYSELFNSTMDKGGNLIHVSLPIRKGYKEPAFLTTGKYITDSGLSIGDLVIVKYDYGIIRVRKIDPNKLGFKNVQIITTTCIKHKTTKEQIPKVRLSGDWLSDIGFTINSVATAASEAGSMTLTLENADTGERAFMKYLRGNKMKLVQVSKEPHNRGMPLPCIGITGSCVETAVFHIGDMLAASYDYGVIQLQKLDFDKLGF